MKVLVPFDILHPVQPTVDQLKRLVPVKDALVHFLYVKEELPSYELVVHTSGDFKDDWNHQIEARVKDALADAEKLFEGTGTKVSSEMVAGPPAFMIETVARNGNFDMTVVTPHQSKLESLVMGTTSGNVVKHGVGTTLICRPLKSAPAGPLKVLMGIDGSQAARQALKLAASQFDLKDAEVTLVHFVSVPEIMKMVSPVEYISMVESNLLLEGETFLAEGKRILADQGITRVSVVLKEGDPTAEMLKYARSLPADLIVIGAQGRTAVQHFLLGSVSQKISSKAPCSTAVIKSVHSGGE